MTSRDTVLEDDRSKYPGPWVHGSRTSLEAAIAALPAAAGQRDRVLEAIRVLGPVTDEQIQDALGMNPSTQRPRRVELAREGLIVEAEALGVTRSGRRAVQWVIPEDHAPLTFDLGL